MKSVADQIRQIAERSGKKTETVVRETLFRVGQSVVLMTPVDSGRARANWLHGIGNYTQKQLDDTDKSGGVAINALNVGLEKLSIGQTFYFTNSLPYAQKLEYGSSLQAPAGMVRVSVEGLPMVLEQEINRIK